MEKSWTIHGNVHGIYGNSMENSRKFNGNLWKFYGTLIKFPWTSMEILWKVLENSMEIYGNYMENMEILWKKMKNHRLQNSVFSFGNTIKYSMDKSWKCTEILWKIHGISMEISRMFYGCAW